MLKILVNFDAFQLNDTIFQISELFIHESFPNKNYNDK